MYASDLPLKVIDEMLSKEELSKVPHSTKGGLELDITCCSSALEFSKVREKCP